jgi:hypothetical protein
VPLAAVGEIIESPESPPSRTASHAAASISSSGAGRADAWWKRAAAAHVEAVRSFLKRLKSWLWQLIDSVLEVGPGVRARRLCAAAAACDGVGTCTGAASTRPSCATPALSGARPHNCLHLLQNIAARRPKEFEPWLKWVILDAVLALAAAAIVQRVESLRPTFELFGWA